MTENISNHERSYSLFVIEKPKQSITKRLLLFILGLVFLSPAVIVTVVTRLLPAVQMILLSFKELNLAGGNLRSVQFSHYQDIFQSFDYSSAFLFGAILMIVRILVVLLPPLILAFFSTKLNRMMRRIVRIASSIPLLFYSPVGLGITWYVLMNPEFGYGTAFFNFIDPVQAPWVVLTMDALSYLGVSISLGFMIYMAALKGGRRSPSTILYRTLTILLVLIAVITIGLSFQVFNPIYILNQSNTSVEFKALMVLVFESAFNLGRPDIASAMSVPVLLIVMGSGILASVIAIITQLRLFVLPENSKPARLRSWLKTTALVLAVIPIAGIGISILPYFFQLMPLFNAPGVGLITEIQKAISGLDFAGNLLHTWVSPLLTIFLIQFPITYLAAVGIGVIRPLGKDSEWLLLFFAPWLLVSDALLAPTMLQFLHLFNLEASFVAPSFPFLINIPMLFILTFFFKGQGIHLTYGEKPDYIKTHILPSLPLAALFLIGGLIAYQQSVAWPMVIARDIQQRPLPLLFVELMNSSYISWQGIGGLFLIFRFPGFIIASCLIGIFQLVFLPRLGIKTGKMIY